MIDEIIQDVRDEGLRDLADSMDYLRSRANDISDPEDILDVHDLPLREKETIGFVSCVAFGALLDREMSQQGVDIVNEGPEPCPECGNPVEDHPVRCDAPLR